MFKYTITAVLISLIIPVVIIFSFLFAAGFNSDVLFGGSIYGFLFVIGIMGITTFGSLFLGLIGAYIYGWYKGKL
jgi:hypothetical protein